MSRALDASRRSRLAFGEVSGLLLGLALAVLLPAVMTSDAASPAMAGATLALVALLALVSRSPSWASRPRLVLEAVGDAPPIELTGRVTDPVHHPLRPRAPGRG